MGASLGWGDEGVSGDMGLEPEAPSSPRPSTQSPQDSPAGISTQKEPCDDASESEGFAR
jgi:hypothetical protein